MSDTITIRLSRREHADPRGPGGRREFSVRAEFLDRRGVVTSLEEVRWSMSRREEEHLQDDSVHDKTDDTDRGEVNKYLAYEDERACFELMRAVFERWPMPKDPPREKKLWEIYGDDYEAKIDELITTPRK